MATREPLIFTLIAGALLVLAPAAADGPPDEGELTFEWHHGTGGLHLANGLVPFHARLENSTENDLVVRLDGAWDEAPVRVRRRIELAAGARKEVDFYLGPAARQSDFQVRLRDGDGEVLEEVLFSSVPVAAGETVVGIVGSHPLGWGSLQPSPSARRERRRSRLYDGKVAYLDTAVLPGRAEGLRALDVLIWPDPRPWELGREQVRAVSHWVETGGHLVLAVSHGARLALRPFTGIRVVGERAVSELASLATVAGASPPPFSEPLAAVALAPGSARVWLRESWGPVAAEESRGRGTVTVLGFNPGDPQLARWPGLGKMWLGLLARRGLAAVKERENSNLPRFFSTSPARDAFDLRSTAADLLTTNAGGPPLPLGRLGLIFMLYLAVIGPGEHLLLRRLGRLRWTWLTFPAWVALFSLAAYALVASSKSDVALVRHILVRDLAPGAERFSEELHAALFVTRGGEHRLASRSPETLPIVGSGRHASMRFCDQGTAAILGRTAKWSFLTGTFLGHAPAAGAGVDAELWWDPDFPGHLVPRLGVDLREAWLVVATEGMTARLELGPLRDGVPVDLADGQRIEGMKPAEFPTGWSEAGAELSQLARHLAYETVRGLLREQWRQWQDQRWKGRNPSHDPVLENLDNDPHPQHDWSPWLAADGAVLIGWAADPEPRVASQDFETVASGIVIYRVALPFTALPFAAEDLSTGGAAP